MLCPLLPKSPALLPPGCCHGNIWFCTDPGLQGSLELEVALGFSIILCQVSVNPKYWASGKAGALGCGESRAWLRGWVC